MNSPDLTDHYKLPHHGKAVDIQSASSITQPKANTLVYVKKTPPQQLIDTLNKISQVFVIFAAGINLPDKLNFSYTFSPTPMNHFVMAQNTFNLVPELDRPVQSGYPGKVSIGEYTKIGNKAVIGIDSSVGNHVSISDYVDIGANCLIKPGAVIGEIGFGYIFDEKGIPYKRPHTGTVKIEDNVEVGSNTVICRATMDQTKIGKNTKIDDMVFIAHNVIIGERCIIVAKAEISGSVNIGDGAWLGPNCTIQNQIKIGKNAVIGSGAVVVRDVKPNSIVTGVPARHIRYRKEGEYF